MSPIKQRGGELLFERIGDALFLVLAYAETDGHIGVAFVREWRDVGTCAFYTEGLGGPSRGERGEGFHAIAAIAAALEEQIVLFRADRQQTELAEAGIGIDHKPIREIRTRGKPFAERPASSVGEREVVNARIGSEQFPVLARTYQMNPRRRVTLFHGREDHAGDGNVRAQRHTRKYENVLGTLRRRARGADPLIALNQAPGRQFRPDIGDHLTEQVRVGIAKPAFEHVAQTLDNLGEKSAAGFGGRRGGCPFQKLFQRCAGPWASREATLQNFAREIIAGSIFQPAAPAFSM